MAQIHRIIVYFVATLAILIAVLDFLGVEVVVQHLSQRIAELTLVTVGFLALHMAMQDSKLSRIARDTFATPTIIVKALQGVRFEEFGDASVYWRYVARRIESAKKSVDDLTWGRTPTAQITSGAKEAYANYRKAIHSVTQGKGSHAQVVYREIMSFPDGYRVGRARALLEDRFRNYHLRFYDYDHKGTPRQIQFLLIDQEELLLGIHGETGLAGKFVSITSAGLVQAMSAYFETCWREGILLKDASRVDHELWKSLEGRFSEVHT
jgi:hypothetical protein